MAAQLRDGRGLSVQRLLKFQVDRRRSAPDSTSPGFGVQRPCGSRTKARLAIQEEFWSRKSVAPGATVPGWHRVGWQPDALTTLEATADALMEMDLVITVDTMLAHLAGALGRPVWTLLAFAADMRWIAWTASSGA